MTYQGNDEPMLTAFRDLADAMAGPEPRDWEWVGEHMSQRMFGITERRAKEYAERFGGVARKTDDEPHCHGCGFPSDGPGECEACCEEGKGGNVRKGMPTRLGTIRAGQTVRTVVGGMRGKVRRVVKTASTPYATVEWSNGSVGRHTVTTLVVVEEAPRV